MTILKADLKSTNRAFMSDMIEPHDVTKVRW